MRAGISFETEEGGNGACDSASNKLVDEARETGRMKLKVMSEDDVDKIIARAVDKLHSSSDRVKLSHVEHSSSDSEDISKRLKSSSTQSKASTLLLSSTRHLSNVGLKSSGDNTVVSSLANEVLPSQDVGIADESNIGMADMSNSGLADVSISGMADVSSSCVIKKKKSTQTGRSSIVLLTPRKLTHNKSSLSSNSSSAQATVGTTQLLQSASVSTGEILQSAALDSTQLSLSSIVTMTEVPQSTIASTTGVPQYTAVNAKAVPCMGKDNSGETVAPVIIYDNDEIQNTESTTAAVSYGAYNQTKDLSISENMALLKDNMFNDSLCNSVRANVRKNQIIDNNANQNPTEQACINIASKVLDNVVSLVDDVTANIAGNIGENICHPTVVNIGNNQAKGIISDKVLEKVCDLQSDALQSRDKKQDSMCDNRSDFIEDIISSLLEENNVDDNLEQNLIKKKVKASKERTIGRGRARKTNTEAITSRYLTTQNLDMKMKREKRKLEDDSSIEEDYNDKEEEDEMAGENFGDCHNECYDEYEEDDDEEWCVEGSGNLGRGQRKKKLKRWFVKEMQWKTAVRIATGEQKMECKEIRKPIAFQSSLSDQNNHCIDNDCQAVLTIHEPAINRSEANTQQLYNLQPNNQLNDQPVKLKRGRPKKKVIVSSSNEFNVSDCDQSSYTSTCSVLNVSCDNAEPSAMSSALNVSSQEKKRGRPKKIMDTVKNRGQFVTNDVRFKNRGQCVNQTSACSNCCVVSSCCTGLTSVAKPAYTAVRCLGLSPNVTKQEAGNIEQETGKPIHYPYSVARQNVSPVKSSLPNLTLTNTIQHLPSSIEHPVSDIRNQFPGIRNQSPTSAQPSAGVIVHKPFELSELHTSNLMPRQNAVKTSQSISITVSRHQNPVVFSCNLSTKTCASSTKLSSDQCTPISSCTFVPAPVSVYNVLPSSIMLPAPGVRLRLPTTGACKNNVSVSEVKVASIRQATASARAPVVTGQSFASTCAPVAAGQSTANARTPLTAGQSIRIHLPVALNEALVPDIINQLFRQGLLKTVNPNKQIMLTCEASDNIIKDNFEQSTEVNVVLPVTASSISTTNNSSTSLTHCVLATHSTSIPSSVPTTSCMALELSSDNTIKPDVQQGEVEIINGVVGDGNGDAMISGVVLGDDNGAGIDHTLDDKSEVSEDVARNVDLHSNNLTQLDGTFDVIDDSVDKSNVDSTNNLLAGNNMQQASYSVKPVTSCVTSDNDQLVTPCVTNDSDKPVTSCVRMSARLVGKQQRSSEQSAEPSASRYSGNLLMKYYYY